MIQFEIRDARVLDLFAGSGQLGLEAVSRGAREAIFCDRSRDAVAVIRRNIQKTRMERECEVFCTDYQAALTALRGKEPFSLVFLDPPYALGAIPTALSMLIENRLLADGALIVCETGDAREVFFEDADLAARFELIRQARYAAASVTVLRFLERT